MLKRLFRHKREKISPAWILAGIVLLAAILRLANIGTEPYWGDEILSLDIYTGFAGLGEMVQYIAAIEIHPPHYYILVKPWAAWFGSSEAATRSLSLIFSLAIVVTAFYFGRSVSKSTKVGLITAFLVAILPIQVEYGQEARPYAMYTLFAVLVMWAVWEFMSSRNKGWLALYILSAAAGLYLHYSFMFTIAAVSLWWLLNDLRTNKKCSKYLMQWFLTHAVIFLVFAPWLNPFLHKLMLGNWDIFGLARNDSTLREPGVLDMSLDRIVWLSWTEYVPRIQILAAAIFKIALVFATLIVLAPIAGRTTRKISRDRQRWLFLAFLSVVPIIFFIASPASLAYTDRIFRHMLPITVPLMIFVAMVANRLSGRWGKLLLALFVVTLMPYLAFVMQNDATWNYKHRVSEVAQYINDNYRPGDVVVVSYNFARSNISHYLRPEIPVETLVPAGYFGHDFMRARTRLGLIENESQFRVPKTTKAQAHLQLDRIDQLQNRPERFWLYGMRTDDLLVHTWFDSEQWRHAFQSISGLFLLDMYDRR